MIRPPLRPSLLTSTFPSSRYICKSCQSRTPRLAQRFISSSPRWRSAQQAHPAPQQHVSSSSQRAPNMDAARQYFKHGNKTILNYTLSLLIGVVAASYGSVPLYKTICQQMGWGGQPVKSKSHFGPSSGDDDEDIASRVVPQTDAHRIRITFSGSTSSILPWRFTPQQREVRVLPGETALAFYTATNTSKEDVIGVATYSVTPDKVAPYFSKIQCFCFEEQRLAAGESVDMPVFFYIDSDFVKDVNVRKIETVTLHYTFFKAKYDKAGHLYPVPMRA